MSTVTLEVSGLDAALSAFRSAWTSGRAEPGPRIAFASPELLWELLTARRWELLRAMTGKGPMSLRAMARAVGRGVREVHADAAALAAAGILHRTPALRFEFPHDAVHVDFMLRAA